MNNAETEGAKARFHKYLDSMSMQKTLNPKVTNGDAKIYDPTKRPSPERIDAIHKAYVRSVLR